MLHIFRDESGVALVTVMVIILLLTILGAGIMTSAILENKVVQSLEDQKQAYYLAQAGIEYARFQLQKDVTWRTNNYTENLGNGSFILNVGENGAGVFKIASTGKVGRITRTLEVGGAYAKGKPPIAKQMAEYMVIGGSSVIFDNHAEIYNGDLRSNGNVIFNNNGYVEGQTIASGNVTGWNTNVTTGAQQFPVPDVDWNELKQRALTSGKYMTSWNQSALRNGVVNYVDASVTNWKLDLTLDGILVIKGNWICENTTDIKSNTGLVIFVDGEVTMRNQKDIDAVIFATGNIIFSQQTNLHGAVYSKRQVICHNNTTMYLEPSPLFQTVASDSFIETEASPGTEDSLSFTSWTEI